MKPLREDINANPNPPLKFELWLQNTCNELAALRVRQRELAQPASAAMPMLTLAWFFGADGVLHARWHETEAARSAADFRVSIRHRAGTRAAAGESSARNFRLGLARNR